MLGLYGSNGWTDNLSGQVSQNAEAQNSQDNPQDVSWPGAVSKSLTLTPGFGQLSANRLHFGRQVVLNLYNPNPYAMRFETTQRFGKDYSWVVPANSQRTVAFRNWNVVGKEVRFLSYQDPASLTIAQGKVTQPQPETALIGPPQPAVSTLSPAEVPPENPAFFGPSSQPPTMRSQSQSAVRGYW
jgi:hypothetical protein